MWWPPCRTPVVSAYSALSPSITEQLEVELNWIDEHVGDHPYGVDIVIPPSTRA